MTRKSSIHFKPVSNVRFAVSHSERTDLSEPAYLLPKEHQLNNIVVTGSVSENDLSALFIQQKEGMTGQAKARGSSPFWEGVVVLPNTDGQEQSANLQVWKNEYEKATGHKVLHMSVHLDEGYLDALGKPQYNPHAHVIVTRMDSKNRVINLDRKQLAQVQDLTAETLQMERGSTLAERQGKRGRAHVPHREFRAQADEKRLELGKEKGQSELYGKLLDSQNAISKDQRQQLKDAKAEVTQIKAQYLLDREAMKASGTATQKAYQALKADHEAALAELKATKEKVNEMDEYTKKLNADLVKSDEKIALELIAKAEAIEALVQAGIKSEALLVTAEGHRAAAEKLTGELAVSEEKVTQLSKDLADAKRFAAMANNYQADRAKGTPAHLIQPEPAKTAQEPPKAAQAPIAPPTTAKTPREAFLEVYGALNKVELHMIDGARLDASDGQLGVFSWQNRVTGGRNQVLCDVPFNKVMPKVGDVFDSRAVPGRGKGGIGG